MECLSAGPMNALRVQRGYRPDGKASLTQLSRTGPGLGDTGWQGHTGEAWDSLHSRPAVAASRARRGRPGCRSFSQDAPSMRSATASTVTCSATIPLARGRARSPRRWLRSAACSASSTCHSATCRAGIRHQLFADQLVHSWDRARAIGSEEQLDGGLIVACSAWFAGVAVLYLGGGVVAPRVSPSAMPTPKPCCWPTSVAARPVPLRPNRAVLRLR